MFGWVGRLRGRSGEQRTLSSPRKVLLPGEYLAFAHPALISVRHSSIFAVLPVCHGFSGWCIYEHNDG